MFQQQPLPQQHQHHPRHPHPHQHQATPYASSYADYGLRQDIPQYDFQGVQLELQGGLGPLGGFGPGPGGVLAGVSAVSASGSPLPVGVGGPQGGAVPAPLLRYTTNNPASSFPGHAATPTIPSTSFAHNQNQNQTRNRVVVPSQNHPSSSLRNLSRHLKMEAPDDLAAQEAAARDYQPRLEGPLVGEKRPSEAITEEYARADPVYIQKTSALPQTYTHFRPVKGDGNCGWRAIGFSYFEMLIRGGNQAQVNAELVRLTGLTQYLETVGGYDPYLFEDMVQETLDLLQEISACLTNPDTAMAILTQKFNDLNTANAIIYHLRLLASAWLKGNTDQYIGFIPDDVGLPGDARVQGYCQAHLEPPDHEIEHMGIELLVNVLLKPAGFVLEIAYLDRTPGSQVNHFRFPSEANNQDAHTLGPIIYLLFRPDHYDILYRPPLSPVDIQVHRVSSFTQVHEITSTVQDLGSFATLDMSPLSLLPFAGSESALSPMISTPDASPLGDQFGSDHQSGWLASTFVDDGLSSSPIPPQQQSQLPQQQGSLTSLSIPDAANKDHPLRFSVHCHPRLAVDQYQYANPGSTEHWAEQQPMFTSSTFKNSHFNTAHYNNPNFQPEEYRPDADDDGYSPGGLPMTSREGKSRKRSTKTVIFEIRD